MLIRTYSSTDEAQVIELWQECNLTRPWNNPRGDIKRKLTDSPGLFLVGVIENRIVATAMAGYDGHRGWVNYLAVSPIYQRRGLGRALMEAVEERLASAGCPKINLQIRTDNAAALKFYEKLGYKTDPVVSMGKRLVEEQEALWLVRNHPSGYPAGGF